MGIVRNFLEFNSTLSRLGTIKNMSEYGTHVEYLRLAAILFSVPDVNRVVDIAAGSSWQFPITYKEVYGLELTGVDIDADSLKLNNTLDFRFVNDVCSTSEIGTGNYDLLTCYSGIEHFPDVQRFLENAFRSLRPGGAVIAQFPSSLAPFALINRALPHRLKTKLLNSLFPSKEIGYRAFYDKCRYTSFRAAAERSGFQIEYYLPSYMSSDYFSWLLPLFCLSQLLDIVRLVFSPKDLASYNLFVLRRPGKHFAIKWSWHS
jgi:ubiquinone/menaquinone biosynthesis C-methylase UbiE